MIRRAHFLYAALSFGAGALAAFSMAPYHYVPLLFVGLSGLYWMVAQTARPLGALLYGALFGFGYFVFGLSWIGNALLVEGNDYAWAWPLAVMGLPLILMPFIALPCWLSRKIFNLKTAIGFVGFVFLMGTFEFARGHVFSGFPWNLFGYSWGGVLEIAQLASVGNVYTLSVMTIMWGAAFGVAFVVPGKIEKVVWPVVALITLIAAYGYGHWRLGNIPTQYDENVQLRIIQPNINQADKWTREKMALNFFKTVRMSYPTKDDKAEITTVLVWPETAISYHFLNDPASRKILSQALSSYPGEVLLLTGALRRDEDGAYYNSLLVFDKTGEIVQTYDKHHLVPFGEYIPFQDWIPLEPVAKFTGFQTGERPKAIKLGNRLNILPLICYEAIFPHLSVDKGANLIVNVTNDAWYGDSAGPRQHLLQTRFRAIESGIPLIRVANTGTSAIIDSAGRVLEQTALFEATTRTHLLPKNITSN